MAWYGAPLSTTELSMDGIAPVAHAIARARRIAVLCGAGISCAAGIPDFRSGEGLFKTLKDRNPRAGLTSGKDLFTASLFNSEASTALFYQMITELRAKADEAQPTSFHLLLKQLDDMGKLFRVYTQNIDGLEQKAGLSCGLDAVGRAPTKPPSVIGVKRKQSARRSLDSSSSLSDLSPSESEDATSDVSTAPSSHVPSAASSTKGGRKAPATAAACRVVPLHGSMHTISCGKCQYRMPLDSPHLEQLSTGQSMGCPKCCAIDQSRRDSSVRARGIGVMRVDVVLYGEEHIDALRIGEITQRDLMGPRPDLLLVVGTSLRVPGTKRLVRELAKVVQPIERKDGDVRAVYVNLWEPPSDFKGVFDTWLRADVQDVAQAVCGVVREKAQEQAKKMVQRSLGFPVVGKGMGATRGPKNKRKKTVTAPAVATARAAPPPPKRKPGFDYVEMPEKNVFLEPIPTVLGPRNARLKHAYVSPTLTSTARLAPTMVESNLPGPIAIPPENDPGMSPPTTTMTLATVLDSDNLRGALSQSSPARLESLPNDPSALIDATDAAGPMKAVAAVHQPLPTMGGLLGFLGQSRYPRMTAKA